MAEHPPLQAEREAVSEHGRNMVAQGLTEGVGGNLSQRGEGDLVAISPSGIPYDRISPEMVPVVDLDGAVQGDDVPAPSSETPMHTMIYRSRPDVGAVVHTHSPYATAFASLGEPVPPTHYLVSFVGDEVPVAGYATPGTEALGREAVDALGEEYSACLLQSHGVIAVGDDVENALETALMVEFCARNHQIAATLGDPIAVPDESIAELRESLAEYRSIK